MTNENAAKQKLEEKYKDVEVLRTGHKIIVPEDMPLKMARIWLERREVEEEQEIAIDEIIEAFPLEGAFAFAKAISRTYGFSALVPTPGFFVDNPPVMIGVDVDVDKTEQVPWGRVQIPNISGYLETGITVKDNRMLFRIGGEVKQKNKGAVKALAELTREIVAKESIYRGKAIRVQFEEDPRKFNPRDCPKFIDTRQVRVEELIFSEAVKKMVTTSLFTPIEHTAACREYKIPLKRGILLEGPFGTGKTLTAYVAAKKCVEQNWTFIYLSKVEDLNTAIHFAKSYQPCVIFAEDIDRVMVEGERHENAAVNNILNTIDGVDTKGMELIVCLTTNHVEHIEPAMMRPGRLDAVISVRAPDDKASLDLVRLYARGRLDNSQDFTLVGTKLSGQIPAVIREVVERSKLAAVSRLAPGEKLLLQASDLEFAADEMLNHLRLMTPRPEDARSDVEKAADSLGQHLAGALTPKPNHNNGKHEAPRAATA